MVILTSNARRRRRSGMLNTEFVVAFAILLAAVIPLAASWWAEARALRSTYVRAVAMEIVDGELEVLTAGGWKQLKPGVQEYTVTAGAATNLPPGRFTATLGPRAIRLEWRRTDQHVAPVVREARLP